jgi:hypothetical protein
MYLKTVDALKEMQKALDMFAHGEMQHDIWSRQVHVLGFQGLKRWHRLQSKKDREARIELQHYIIDMFGVNLEPTWDYVPSKADTLESILNSYIDWEIEVYSGLANIGNSLITMELPEEARMVSKHVKGVRKEIEKARRKIMDYNMVNWDMAYIKEDDKILHDKIKEME